jgi:hypothetical protein
MSYQRRLSLLPNACIARIFSPDGQKIVLDLSKDRVGLSGKYPGSESKLPGSTIQYTDQAIPTIKAIIKTFTDSLYFVYAFLTRGCLNLVSWAPWAARLKPTSQTIVHAE